MSAERLTNVSGLAGWRGKTCNDSRLTLNLGHSLHTVVGSQNRVGLAVNPVPSLVLVPHVCSQDTVADGLADVSSKHGLSS